MSADLIIAARKTVRWLGKAIADDAFASCVHPSQAKSDLEELERALARIGGGVGVMGLHQKDKIEWGAGTSGPWEMDGNCDWSIDTESSNACIWIGPKGCRPIAAAVEANSSWDDLLNANARAIVELPAMVQALRLASDMPEMTAHDPALHRIIHAILSRIDGETA